MPTANQAAFDRGVSHAIHMQRLKTGEVNKIVGFLNDKVLPDAKAKLAARLERLATRGMDKGPHTTKRVKDMIDAVTGTISGGLRESSATLQADLKDIVLTEAQWQQSVLRSAAPSELGLSFNIPTTNQLKSIITSRPFEGDILSGWAKKLDRATRAGISEQIQIGIAQGETNQQIIRRLAGTKSGAFMDGAFGKLRRNVAAVTQTATQHVATQAREMTYKENDDIIKGVQIVATLDSRTTEICMSEDGKVYPVEEGPRPPFHWNCRTTTIPVLKSFEELGFKAQNIPPATRASMNGQVPARQTYQGWLRSQPASVQDDALGPVKGALFRKHKIEVTSFVDDKRRILTIDQLRVKEGLPILGVPTRTLDTRATRRAWWSSLEPTERRAVRRWTEFSTDLREVQAGVRKGTKSLRDKNNAFVSAMQKSPRNAQPVWRGLSDVKPSGFRRLQTGKTIELDAFASASTIKKEAADFATGDRRNVLLHFRKQSRGTNLKEFAESEVVLHQKEKFRIVKRFYTPREKGAADFLLNIVLEEM